MTGREDVPLPGPLDAEPQIPMWQALQQLSASLEDLPLGAWDSRIHLWLSEKDAGTVATIASLLRRAWISGVEIGRAERVDEQPKVAELRAVLSTLVVEQALVRQQLRDERAEVDRLRATVAAIAAAVKAFDEDPCDWDHVTALLAAVDGALGGAS
jgi:hypothetical protein